MVATGSTHRNEIIMKLHRLTKVFGTRSAGQCCSRRWWPRRPRSAVGWSCGPVRGADHGDQRQCIQGSPDLRRHRTRVLPRPQHTRSQAHRPGQVRAGRSRPSMATATPVDVRHIASEWDCRQPSRPAFRMCSTSTARPAMFARPGAWAESGASTSSTRGHRATRQEPRPRYRAGPPWSSTRRASATAASRGSSCAWETWANSGLGRAPLTPPCLPRPRCRPRRSGGGSNLQAHLFYGDTDISRWQRSRPRVDTPVERDPGVESSGPRRRRR